MPPSLRRISIVGAISLLGLVVVDRHLLNTVVQRGSNNRTIHLQWDDRGITTPKAEQPQGEQIDACNPWAPWSLQSQSASWRPLRCLNAYDAVTSHNGRRRAWNAFAILGPMLSRAGYRGNCFSRVGSHTRHSLVLSEVQALQNTVQGCILPFSDVIFTPNFWAPAAPDWRQWRLMPCQRINRIWGIDHLSNKTKLVETLHAATASGLLDDLNMEGRMARKDIARDGDQRQDIEVTRDSIDGFSAPNRVIGTRRFFPASHIWASLSQSADWKHTLRSTSSRWLLKREQHRGDGVRLVDVADILDEASAVSAALAAHPTTVIQQFLEAPLLIAGLKFSLRLYSLVTCALPLRVYIYPEGFALFATDRMGLSMSSVTQVFLPALQQRILSTYAYDPFSLERTSFITNAFVNQNKASRSRRRGHVSSDGAEELAARTLSLVLPPRVQRWRLSDMLVFLAAVHAPKDEGHATHGDNGNAVHQSGRNPRAQASILQRSIQRVVLLTWASALPQLSRASREGLMALGLSSPAEWATNFELLGVDLLIDAEWNVWLIEMNGTPSLAPEEEPGITPPCARDSSIKAAMLMDTLTLADVVPEEEEGITRDSAGGGTPRLPPEAVLFSLYERNAMGPALIGRANDSSKASRGSSSGVGFRLVGADGERSNRSAKGSTNARLAMSARVSTSTAACSRRWRLGGCRWCPLWSEVGELWRASIEERRAGRWVPLSPSLDAEWRRMVARAAHSTDVNDAMKARRVMMEGDEVESGPMEARHGVRHKSASWSQALLTAWIDAAFDEQRCSEFSHGHHSEACLMARWNKMLCGTREVGLDEMRR